MIIYSKILVAHEASHRYIGGDFDKAYLMLVKERYEGGWYEDLFDKVAAEQAIRDGDATQARLLIESRKRFPYEYVSEITLEEAKYLKDCPDITKRFYELVDYCRINEVWGQWLEITHTGFTEQHYREAEEENNVIPSPADYVSFQYDFADYETFDNYDYTSFWQEFFGDVKVSNQRSCREVEIYR